MLVEAYGLKDTGRERRNNEDHVSVQVVRSGERPVGIFVCADGVGGRQAGEVASGMFAELVTRKLSATSDLASYTTDRDRELRQQIIDRVATAAIEAGTQVYRRAEEDGRLAGMSTTGVVLVTVDRGAFLVHAGDSRAYLLRGDRVFRLTEDHTLGNEMKRRGLITQEELAKSHVSGVLSRAFGNVPRTEVDRLFVRMEPGDRFLLCSDGLHRYFRGADLLDRAKAQPDSKSLVTELIVEANEKGGEDNISVVVIETSEARPRTRGKRPRVGLRTQLGFMQDLFLFADLDEQEVHRVNRIVHRHLVTAGTQIIREGAPGQDFYLVLAGDALVSTNGTPLVTLGPSDHFGEMALLDDPPRSADVHAKTDMILMSIHRDDFNALLKQDPVIGNKVLVNLLKFMSRRVRSLTANVRTLTTRG